MEYNDAEMQFYLKTREKQKARPKPKPRERKQKEKPMKAERPKKCSDTRAYDQQLPKDFRSYIMRANAKRIPFELSLEEFTAITSRECVYCGGSGRIGIDRRDSSDGYTLENSYPCCGTCNIMKHTKGHDEFLRQIMKIVRHLELCN